MSRSGHSGTEPWEYPPDAPMGIKSIGELVFELISPLSWSGSMLVRCKWTLYSPRGAKCAHISQQSQGVLSVRPSRCTSREPLRTIRCYRLHVSALEMSLTPGTARPRQYHDSREHSACRCFLGRACIQLHERSERARSSQRAPLETLPSASYTCIAPTAR